MFRPIPRLERQYWLFAMIQKVLRYAPPGQRNVREERIQRRRLLAPVLLPEVERLREALGRPQRVVRTVVELFLLWMVVTPVVDIRSVRSSPPWNLIHGSAADAVRPHVEAVVGRFLDLR